MYNGSCVQTVQPNFWFGLFHSSAFTNSLITFSSLCMYHLCVILNNQNLDTSFGWKAFEKYAIFSYFDIEKELNVQGTEVL